MSKTTTATALSTFIVFGAASAGLEHFPEKWSPVFRKKMRPLNKVRVLSGSFEPESTLAGSRDDASASGGFRIGPLGQVMGGAPPTCMPTCRGAVWAGLGTMRTPRALCQ